MTAKITKKNIVIWLFAAAVALGLVSGEKALAAGESPLTVERVYLREILRSYAADPAGFDKDNGPQALAELFTATVGLNYYGEGNPASYFSKDITGKLDAAPYLPENLLGSYDVPIHPVNGRAEASPGQTCRIYVYLTGYSAEAIGAVPVYHYVWQENGSWWAVRDLVPYYRVSYNDMGGMTAANSGVNLCWSRGNSRTLSWTALVNEEFAAVANGAKASFVAAEGTGAVFGAVSGNELLAVSDYVRGSDNATPVIYAKTIRRPDGSVLASGEKLIPGESYRVKLVFDEGLVLAQRGGNVTVSALRQDGTLCGSVSNVVWYGGEEYLVRDDYNPETVEFTVNSTAECSWCVFAVEGLMGFESGGAPAAFWYATESLGAVAPPAATAEPVVNTPEPATVPTAVPTTVSATPAPAFAPDALVTWGDMALRLWQLQGCVDVVNDPTQTDGYRASCWAASVGLCDVWADGGLTVETALTREQLSCVLYAYARHLGRDVSALSDISQRPDQATVSPWALTAVQWAVGSGVLTPAMDGSIAPGATVSHGQLDWMLAALG